MWLMHSFISFIFSQHFLLVYVIMRNPEPILGTLDVRWENTGTPVHLRAPCTNTFAQTRGDLELPIPHMFLGGGKKPLNAEETTQTWGENTWKAIQTVLPKGFCWEVDCHSNTSQCPPLRTGFSEPELGKRWLLKPPAGRQPPTLWRSPPPTALTHTLHSALLCTTSYALLDTYDTYAMLILPTEIRSYIFHIQNLSQAIAYLSDPNISNIQIHIVLAHW